MDFLNWAAEHYWLFFFMLCAAVGVAKGLGNWGTTHHYHGDED
jgi:hypothetical protein